MNDHNSPILIVEDDDLDQELMFSAFKKLNFPNEVVIVKDGEAALNYLRTCSQKPLFIISDINMPKMNGWELRMEIEKDIKLKIQNIPFILMSGADDHDEIQKAFEDKVQGFFHKKINFKETQELLRIIILYWRWSSFPKQSYSREKFEEN